MVDGLLDSWHRSNTITVNLLRAVADDAMDLTPVDSSPTIAQLFAHMDYCRLIFVAEACTRRHSAELGDSVAHLAAWACHIDIML